MKHVMYIYDIQPGYYKQKTLVPNFESLALALALSDLRAVIESSKKVTFWNSPYPRGDLVA